MRGTYKIFKAGKLLAVQNNLITNFGIQYLRQFLTNQVANFGDSIAVGALSTAPTINDITLGFEFSRGEINVRSVVDNNIVIKATLDDDAGGYIYELGLFPTVTNSRAGIFGTQLLSGFDTTQELWAQTGNVNISADSTNYRVGSQSINFSGGSVAATNLAQRTISVDLSGYSIADRFSLLTFHTSTNSVSPTIIFGTTNSDYFSYSYSLSSGSNIFDSHSMGKNDFTVVGNPDWSNITYIQIGLNSSGTYNFNFDGLIINDLDPYQTYGLISHAVLSSPIQKLPGEDFDVEYTVGTVIG